MKGNNRNIKIVDRMGHLMRGSMNISPIKQYRSEKFKLIEQNTDIGVVRLISKINIISISIHPKNLKSQTLILVVYYYISQPKSLRDIDGSNNDLSRWPQSVSLLVSYYR